MAMMDFAASAGVPLPRYEVVVPVGDGGVGVVQERVAGGTPAVVSLSLVDQLLDLTACRRGLVSGTPYEADAMTLFLHTDGPGFCLHESLRARGETISLLLEALEASVPCRRRLAGWL